MEHPEKSPLSPDPKVANRAATQAANRRLGLILLTIAVAFFLGFYVKMVLFG